MAGPLTSTFHLLVSRSIFFGVTTNAWNDTPDAEIAVVILMGMPG
jgi:hypothetical protein